MGLLQDFLRNVFTVILLGSIGIFLVFRFSKRWSLWVWGILFGLIAVITMGDKIYVGPGRFVDFRHVVMALAGYIGGLYPSLIAASIASVYRLVQGGAGIWGGVITVFTFGFIGSWLGKRDLPSDKTGGYFLWLSIGIGLGVIALAIIPLAPPWNTGSSQVVQKVAFPILVFTPFATLFIFKIFLFLQNLFQKSSLFDVFFKNASLPSIVFDDQGHILQASVSFLNDPNLMNYADNPFSLLPGPIFEKIRHDSKFLENQYIFFQREENGETIEITLFKLVPWKDRPVFFMVFLNITEQKKAEKTNQRLATILENSDDAIFTISPTGTITSWNKGATKIYGYTAAEIIGRHYQTLLPPELREERMKRLSAIQREETRDLHLIDLRKDGVRIHVLLNVSIVKDIQDNIIEYFVIEHDISEQVKYEKALTSERELLMITLNSLTEGVIAVDAGGRIFLIHEAALQLTGYSRMEALEQPFSGILYVMNDQTSEPVDIFSTKLSTHLILVTRDLKEIMVAIHHSPIKPADGSIIGSVIIVEDISEKHKTEQELYRADKLESLGILAGGIAHDFNNLLAAILSNIQLAQMKYRKNEDIERYLQESIASTHRASELTRQLLTFSKGGAPVKKAASLAELICDTAQFVLRGSTVKAECQIPETLWPVEVDTGQISQVIHNLVINAKHAMPKGGILQISAANITIESARPGVAPMGAHHRFQPGNYIKIVVKDHGVGIPAENLSKIFDPYYTTKKEGSGLGLATSYSIIKQHDGYLEVESEVGVGTTFYIYLPALSQPFISAANDKLALAREAAVTGERLKILLMDDEEIILKSVGEMLRDYGHHVVLVPDGEIAIESYRKALAYGAPFDVVIMDLTVPGGMGGQEAITHLRNIDPQVTAIVSSGYANDPIISDYQSFGFCGVVTKPYKFDELNEVLKRLGERKQ
jgi:PAS domain S-box-containing protein